VAARLRSGKFSLRSQCVCRKMEYESSDSEVLRTTALSVVLRAGTDPTQTSSRRSSILKIVPLWNSEGTGHKSFPLIYDALGSLMRSIPAYQTICGVAPSALCAMFCKSSCRSAARHCRDRSTTAPSHSNVTFSTREQVEKNWPTRQGSDDPNRNFARGQKSPRQSIGHREKHAADQK